MDPTLLDINSNAACPSLVDSGPSVATYGQGVPQTSHWDNPNTTTPLSYRLLDEVNDEHESSCWSEFPPALSS